MQARPHVRQPRSRLWRHSKGFRGCIQKLTQRHAWLAISKVTSLKTCYVASSVVGSGRHARCNSRKVYTGQFKEVLPSFNWECCLKAFDETCHGASMPSMRSFGRFQELTCLRSPLHAHGQPCYEFGQGISCGESAQHMLSN